MSRLRLLTTLVASPTIQIDSDTGQMYVDGNPIGGFSQVQVQVSSADLLNLKANPKVLLPSLGTGVLAQMLFGIFQYKPNTVDYSIGDAANLVIGSAVNPANLNSLQPISASVLTGAGGPGNVIHKIPFANVVSGAQSQFESQDLVLTHDGSAEITSGDGTAVVTLAYQTVQI